MTLVLAVNDLFLLVQLIVNLYNAITNDKGFLVIGHHENDDKRLGKVAFEGSSVQSMNKLIGEEGQGWIPDGDQVPYGCALLFGTEPNLRRLTKILYASKNGVF